MVKKKYIYSMLAAGLLILLSACSNTDNTDSTPSGESVATNTNNEGSSAAENGGEEASETAEKYEQGVALYNQGKLDEANAVFTELAKADSKRGEYDYYLGNIMRKNQDFPSAMKYYEQAIEKSPELVEAYNNLTALQMAAQDFTKALETANKGLGVRPDFADLQFKKAQILYVSQQFNEAVALFTEVANDPMYFEAHRFLGLSYTQLNDQTKALEHFNEYLKQAPEGVPYKEEVKKMVSELETK